MIFQRAEKLNLESLKWRLVNLAAHEHAQAAAALAIDRLEQELQSLRVDVQSIDIYEREFYPLSNFSAFKVQWGDTLWDTSEHAYQASKFKRVKHGTWIRRQIRTALSAHDAFKVAEQYRDARRSDWDLVKVQIMRAILRSKAQQHEYVRRKLLETGDRQIIEKSWRDDYWGWGPNRDGANMLGKLWMEIRTDLCNAAKAPS